MELPQVPPQSALCGRRLGGLRILKIEMGAALDPEKKTVSLSIHNIPLESLEGVLAMMSEPAWRQNILDGVKVALAARDLGIGRTQRKFLIPED
jgi:hypothetical protein